MKEWLFRIAKAIVLINGIGQLAISQVHILTITKVFAKEIGIFLFMFIIFGMVSAFNTFLLKKIQGMLFFIASCLLTAGLGFVYLDILKTDVMSQETLTMMEINGSWTLAVISIVVCLVGAVVVPLLGWNEMERKKSNE